MISKFLFIALFIFGGQISYGQRSKIAYINTNQLWQAMPEKALADSLLEKEAAEYREYLGIMLNELKTLEEAYQKDLQNERQTLNQEKEKDILQKRKRIEEYSANADKELTARKEELYHPIRNKMQSAIDKVAVQLKYDYVLDASYGNIIYRRNEQDDIIKDVLKELGL